MAQLAFLSDDWLQALGDAVAASLPSDLRTSIAIGQVVTDVESAGGGEVRYTLSLGPGPTATVEAGSTGAAAVVLTISYAAASSLVRGELSAASLLEQGRVKISGDARRLVEAAELFGVVGFALGDLRERTMFP
jgi:hypothetical protein